jgi:hypothetical protein
MSSGPEDTLPCQAAAGMHEVVCTGTPRMLGLQQGRALADLARRSLRDVVLENERIYQIKPRLIPKGLYMAAGKWLAKRFVPRDVEVHYPRQYDRTIGIAEGAGLSIDYLWMTALLEQWPQPGLRLPACTSFALADHRTVFGEAVICRLFDLPPETKPFNVVRWDAPPDRLASMQVTFPQLAGSHTGLNEHGLAVAYNFGYPADRSRCNTSITLIVQEVLERCGNVDEAIELIEQSPRQGGALLTLADARGQIAAVELSSTRTANRPPQDGCLINTNHYQAEATTPMETGFAERAWWWQRRGRRWIGPSSQTRLDRAQSLLASRGEWDIYGLIKVMGDHGRYAVGSDMTICRHAPPYETTFAAILLPARRQMLIAPGQPCCQRFVMRPLDEPMATTRR